MRYLSSFSLVVIALVILSLTINAAFPTPGERTARESEAAARAQAAQAWASQADERAELFSMFLAALAVVTVVGLAGIGYAMTKMLLVRGFALHANTETALYPMVPANRQWQVLNEPSAQQFAALPSHPTAALARTLLTDSRLVGASPSASTIDGVAMDDAPVLSLPSLVSVYDAFRLAQGKMPSLLVGETAGGPLSLPLQNLGNVLVGGLPGSGKSELLAAMIAGLLPHPKMAQVAVIDPKLVDFGTIPPDLAGLWAPVATDQAGAIDLLGEVLAECQRRFAMLKDVGARSLAAYNSQAEPLPYLVAFIDELADFAGDKRFGPLALEIGRKGRAAGVSLVLATQRPSADVVDSSLRAVAGAAVAFRVRNVHDSRTIIGDGGAELLPPDVPGRCIVQRGDLTQCQAYYAGLASGQFDRHLAALPRGRGDALRNARRVTEGAVTQATLSPEARIIDVSPADVSPAMPTNPSVAASEVQRRYVLDAYRRSGHSLRATQRMLFPGQSEGGHWFYWIRAIVNSEDNHA